MAEKVLTYVFLLGSLFYTVFANTLAFGVVSSPKAGFLPTIVGVSAVILLCLIMLTQQHRTTQETVVNWRKFLLLILGLVFYLICLSVAGYLSATFLIMLYLLKCMEVNGWLLPLVISAAAAGIFYGVFNELLNITLP